MCAKKEANTRGSDRRMLWRKRRSSSTERPRKDGGLQGSAAIITEEMAGDEDRKFTSRGVFVAKDSNLGAVAGAEEGAIESIPGNEGRIAQAWVNVRGGLRIFSVYIWHSEDGRQEMKPCLKQF